MQTVDPNAPTGWVHAHPDPSLDQATQDLYQRMATALSGYTAVPEDRLNYYADYVDNIGSWGGVITGVTHDGNGGYFVKMTVSGRIAPDQLDGDSMVLLTEYSEIYHVDSNFVVTYTQFSLPDGASPKASFVGAG